jgi:pimeloyl-ACP methyl ester carboxylesterase
VATLYQERIARGDPRRWLVLTHGIYGAGSNWRGIARKVVERRPDWGVILVDLRLHGRSEAGEPPHTVQAAAEDLRAVITEEVAAIAGHSFGGKVVLAARALAPATVLQTWMFDSSPSAREAEDSSVVRVLELMERLPRVWVKRDDFVATVVAEGHDLALAQWLAMNIVPDANGTLVNRLDLPAMRSLLESYYETDLWDVAFDGALPGSLEMVIADRSRTVSEADRARLAQAPPHVHVHHIDAGHWLHIEAPASVVELLVLSLPTALA